MYILVETEVKKMLFESIDEMDESLRLNNLYPKVKAIKEVDKETFHKVMRELVEQLRETKRNK